MSHFTNDPDPLGHAAADFQDTEGDAYEADQQKSLRELAHEPVADLDEEVTSEAVIAQPNATEAADDDLESLLQPVDDFADLNSLLDESMLQRKVQADAKAARERIRRGGQSQGEREADLLRIKDWQDKYEWEPIATAGVFNRYTCQCGNTNTVFDCIMVEERHKTDKFSKRFVNVGVEKRSSPRVGEPPKVTVVRECRTLACDKCAHTKGWRLDDPTVWRG